MRSLIIYGSQYGTAKCYAEKLSEMKAIPMINYEDIKNLTNYETIIHFGGLYTGGVRGLKNAIKVLPKNANIIFATVGLVDITDIENTDTVKKSISKQVPKENLRRCLL